MGMEYGIIYAMKETLGTGRVALFCRYRITEIGGVPVIRRTAMNRMMNRAGYMQKSHDFKGGGAFLGVIDAC